MKHLLSFLCGLFFLFSMAGNISATNINGFQNANSPQNFGKNIQKTHHHKSFKSSSFDLTEDDDFQSVSNSLMTAIAVAVAVFPQIFKIFFAEKSIDFSRFAFIFKPNLRQHLLLRKLTI